MVVEQEKQKHTRHDLGVKFVQASVVVIGLLCVSAGLYTYFDRAIINTVFSALVVALNALAALSISMSILCYFDDEPEWSSLASLSLIPIVSAVLIDLVFYLGPI